MEMRKTIHFPNLPLRIAASRIQHKSIHFHPNALEIIFPMEGEMAVTLGQASHLIHAGECIIIAPGKLHTLHCNKPSTAVSLYFDLEHYSERFPYITTASFRACFFDRPDEQADHFRELRNYFIRIMLMHNKNTPAAQTIMYDLAEKMVRMLYLHFQLKPELPDCIMGRYYRVNEYLHQNYRGDISIAYIASSENISVTRLSHFWKHATGLSIRQSITQLRLADAEKMLLQSTMTINEVAHQCHFSDEKYFYQYFRVHFKTTPNDYRMRHLGAQRPTVRTLLTRQENEHLVAPYAMNYYIPELAPSLPDLTPDEAQRESVLDCLYQGILRNPHTTVDHFSSVPQEQGILQVTLGKAIFLRRGEYAICWEYIYAHMHLFLDFNMSITLLIDYDCIPHECWEGLLESLIQEMLNIWGKRVVESQTYLVYSKLITQHIQCARLAEHLRRNTVVSTAQAMYML